MTDRNEIIAFMKRFSFATIVSLKEGVPLATHLPFIVKEKDGELFLTSHFAKANKQWENIEGQTVLVIFTEPHAYISTLNYDKELNVPTWNYLSVHAYGKAELITAYEAVQKILQETIETYERPFLQKWNGFPEDYKERMTNGIVAFELPIHDLQAKKKLSQNRTEREKAKIIDALSKSSASNDKLIADYMKKEK